MSDAPYHHGGLRAALVSAAEELLAERGLEGFTLREAARRAGVSAAAPKHHFGDLRGLLTAVAIGGFRRLEAALSAAQHRDGAYDQRLLRQGRAYVDFALAHPAMFDLMFRRAMIDADRPDLIAAGAAAYGVLEEGVRQAAGPRQNVADLALAAWSLVHGFARLLLDGQLDPLTGGDPQAFVEARLQAVIETLKMGSGVALDDVR